MISWEQINLTFGEKQIFKDFDFRLEVGEKVLIKNKSGSGKTTLLKTSMGLTSIDSGMITVNNIPLTPNSISNIRSKIFYLDQDVTLPELTVEEVFLELMHYKYNKDMKFNKDVLIKHLTTFKLEKDILSSNIKELSGGERQRIGLIIGLLLNRPIWLLDEPTSALDDELKKIVAKLLRELPITCAVISHDNCWDSFIVKTWEIENE